MAIRRGILGIDEGTTGTRAAVVLDDGSVGRSFYEPIALIAPDSHRVEQDPAEIWRKTRDVGRRAVAWAADNNIELAGLTIANQRGTSLLWDQSTGEPLANAVVWQDRRYAADVAELASEWDERLLRDTGRRVGPRSLLLWLVRSIRELPAAAAALQRGALRFGTIDSWLMYQLTSGATHTVSATNAQAIGGLDLRTLQWHGGWFAALDVPDGVVPSVTEDAGDLGVTHPDVLGMSLPIVAAVGDQHAAWAALGAEEPGDVTVVHGTGSFVSILTDDMPAPQQNIDNALYGIAWRALGEDPYAVEAYASTTGAAIDWLCGTLNLFDDPAEIGALAAPVGHANRPWFDPSFAGVRTPRADPDATGALGGLSLAGDRAAIARAIVDGIAHSVGDLIDALEVVSGLRTAVVRCGGGLARSQVLAQAQANLSGVAVERAHDFETASLRGAAYLGGVHLGLWPSRRAILTQLPAAERFTPTIGQAERNDLRDYWRDVVLHEPGRKP